MTAPDRIWAIFEPRENDKGNPRVFATCEKTLGIEYARVTPDTITLPRAEVEALMEAVDAGLHRDNCPSIEFINGQCDCGRDDVLAALAALQERMK